MSFPKTTDEPEKLAVLPDFGEGIRQSRIYRTTIQRSRSGIEQRARRKKTANLRIEYLESGSHDSAAAGSQQEAIRNSRKPLLVPWWAQGGRIQGGMTATAFNISTNPNPSDWDAEKLVYLYDPALGGEFRTVISRSSRLFTLAAEVGSILFPEGTFVFPVRLAVREISESMIQTGMIRSQPQTFIFQTL